MNTFIIENEELIIEIRSLGAEITNIHHKKSQTDLILRQNSHWDWFSPVLFPVVGRCFNDKIYVNGKEFKMEKHGFARKTIFLNIQKSDVYAKFQLIHNESIKENFPFDFDFQIHYFLQLNSLIVKYIVKNLGNDEMPFSIGAHPAFSTLIDGINQFEKFFVEFEKEEDFQRHLLTSDGYFSGKKELVKNQNRRIFLRTEDFEKDAIILKNLKSRKIWLKNVINANSIEFQFEKFPYLGLWSKPGASFICIEPWNGCADHEKQVPFENKEGSLLLKRNHAWEGAISMKFE